MFGDNDKSKAVNIEVLFEEIEDLALNPDELWRFSTVKDLFKNIISEDDFKSAYSELVHYLTRTDELDINKLREEPLINNAFNTEKCAMVACAIHFHLSSMGFKVPDWVLKDNYKLKNNVYNSEHPVLKYHGLDLNLKDLGVV